MDITYISLEVVNLFEAFEIMIVTKIQFYTIEKLKYESSKNNI